MSAQEPQPDETGAVAAPAPAPKSRRALSGLKRELTDEELSSTGTQKMLLEELERLNEDNSVMKGYRDDFYRVDRDRAVLREQQKRNIAAEIVSGCCLAIGAAAIGYAPTVWKAEPTGWILLAFGGVLTLGGVIAKAIKL